MNLCHIHNNIGNDMGLNDALILIHCGIEDGHRAAKQECDLTIDNLADSMDGDMEGIARCMEVLAEQMGGNTEKKQKPKKARS